MFEVLESAREIASAQRKFEKTIRKSFKNETTRNIGFPGDTFRDAHVRTLGNYWYHTHHDRDARVPRKVNWFGITPDARSLDISVEINTAYSGATAQVAGFFARDSESGEICLFHSGKVGGGTTGVGKLAFLTWSNPELVVASRSEDTSLVGVLLVRLTMDSSLSPLLRYVDTIVRFKEAVRRGETRTTNFKREKAKFRDFYSEASGRRRGKRSSEIDYITRHGDIVEALNAWRIRQGLDGGRIIKSPLIDLGVEKQGKLSEIYEVKSTAERHNLYTAIGQTLVHSPEARCKRAIVLPVGERLEHDLEDALARLGIGVMRFKLTKSAVDIM